MDIDLPSMTPDKTVCQREIGVGVKMVIGSRIDNRKLLMDNCYIYSCDINC